MTAIKALRQLRGDHEFSLTDDFSCARKVITQTRYFKAGNFVVAIGELNSRNTWNDPAFDAACEFLTAAWKRAASGIETEGHDRAAGRGAEHESPTAESGDAQNIGGPSQ